MGNGYPFGVIVWETAAGSATLPGLTKVLQRLRPGLMLHWRTRNGKLKEWQMTRPGNDCEAPLRFLIERGYLADLGVIYAPRVQLVAPTLEIECLAFLMREWGFSYGELE